MTGIWEVMRISFLVVFLSLLPIYKMDDIAGDELPELPVPLFRHGRYHCPWTGWFKPSMFDAAKWMLCDEDRSNVPSNQLELDQTLPVVKPNFTEDLQPDDIRITWIGHATTLVEMENVKILTDPIFSDRCSPSQLFGTKRYRPPPCSIEELPKIDIVVISHNHYDHLDLNSVQGLNSRFGKGITWLVPKGVKQWMRSCGVENVYELSWWEEHEYSKDLRIISTPCQHWCKRTLFDDNQALWCSWSIVGATKRFFFAGDTGYPLQYPVFEKIGEKYGPFHLSAIPIGAYDPRWMMQEQHVDPEQAVKIHKDVKSRNSIGIHWGTFKLTNEFYLEPREKLKQALQAEGIPEDRFITLKHGESKIFH